MQGAYDRVRTNPSSEDALRHEMLQLCTNVEKVEIYDDAAKL